MTDDFEPNIIGMLCSWCSYAAADGAGASKLAVPPSFAPIRLMCTGRVEPAWILRAFENGADGVLLCGCHFGDCHYVEGNCKAFGRVELLRTVLSQWGLEEQRLRLEWVGATESTRFAEVVNRFTQDVRRLGPIRALAKGASSGGDR